MGGARFDDEGSGVDYQCLPLNPDWLDYNINITAQSLMRSIEYYTKDSGIFEDETGAKRAVCAHCYIPGRTAVTMIPAKTECPSGWHREYYGYLMSSGFWQKHPTTNICVDADPEYADTEFPEWGGGLNFVGADCGSWGSIEECEEGGYINNRQLTCVVCSR